MIGHMGTPVDRLTDTTENITFPQTVLALFFCFLFVFLHVHANTFFL